VRGLDYELLWNKDTDWFGNRDEALTLRFLAGRCSRTARRRLAARPSI
jgi:hypothetical protein